MARVTKKNKAQVNKQLWDRANNSHRQRWQTLSQKGYDFYLDEQLSKEEKDQLEEQNKHLLLLKKFQFLALKRNLH